MFKRVALFGVPRSGTTWLGALFDSHPKVVYRNQPLFSYAFKSRLTESSSLEEIILFFEDIAKTKDTYLLQEDSKRAKIIPSFAKQKESHIVFKETRYLNIVSNLLEKDKDLKIIGIIRNPKSVISSWYLAPKEFDKVHWSLEEEWRYAPKKNLDKLENFYGYCNWKKVSSMFHNCENQYPDQFKIIDYSQLLSDTNTELNSLFNFCNLSINQQTQNFIEHSTSSNNESPYSVFKNKQNDDKWKNVLPKSISNYIDKDLKNTILETYLKE